ncbi:hypothetical protein FJZ31_26830 [Candidatus Poribacteria bacterium]|nr:hypothetical protein [Candidatus Poribacteria bacterium]
MLVIYRQRLFQSITTILKWLFLCLLLFSCDTGKIANLGSIRITADLLTNQIRVRIFLQDNLGNYLVWNDSFLTPQSGMSVIPEEDFTTNVKLYSMRYGDKNKTVYDGRLAGLHWNQTIAETPRILLGDIPLVLIQKDAERDTTLGIIELTLTTPKQGDFFARAENVTIYHY